MATILVVDDRAINREFLAMLLGYSGHRVVEAADGGAAMELVRAQRPDLVITDVVMPGMDGVELAKRLRADPAVAGTPLIFYTASYRLADARGLARSCGVGTVLVKPSTPQVILDAVAAALGVPAAAVKPPALAQPAPRAGQDFDLSLRLSMLIEVGLELAAERDPGQLLDLACRAGRDILGTRYAAVGVVDAATGRLDRFAAQGYTAAAAAGFAAFDGRGGIFGAALRECRPYRAETRPAPADLPAGHPPVDALLVVPLCTATRCYGWFMVADRLAGDDFSAADEQIAATLAGKLAQAYDNLLLYRTLQDNAARLKADSEAIQRLNAGLEQQVAALRSAKAEAERANDAKSRFLAAVSHDLRQPLSALSLYVGALGPKLRPGHDPLLANLKDCVAGLSEMLSNLLDLSRLEAGVVAPDPADFALDDIVARVVAAHAPDARLKGLALRYGSFGRVGRTDPVLFQRIVGNLVSNAIRYTERGGLLLACRRRHGKAWFEVWDTGIGIPADKLAEIFEEFRQLGNYERNRAKGTGLGLTIVAKTAALLGIEVQVRSRPGRGSVFAVELPLGRAVAPAAERRFEHRPLRIALVEDNADVAAALAYALAELGHEVVTAASRRALLPLLDGIAPDIVISDYRLAEAETGFDVVAALRSAFGAALPALVVTGDTDPAVIRRMAAHGIAVQHKPLDIELLRERIADLTAPGCVTLVTDTPPQCC